MTTEMITGPASDMVPLGKLHIRLNEEFTPTKPLTESAVQDWWKRSKPGATYPIDPPMPKQKMTIGRSPVLSWREVKQWYKKWKRG